MTDKPEYIALLDSRAEAGMATSELIGNFKADIRFDCHNTQIAFSRSFAQQELCRRGRLVLPEIITHLKENPPIDGGSLQWVWCRLLNRIEMQIDQEEQSGPESLYDIRGWISWAEKMLEIAPAS